MSLPALVAESQMQEDSEVIRLNSINPLVLKEKRELELDRMAQLQPIPT